MCLVAQCTRCTGSPLSKIYIGNQILAIKTLDKSTKKDKEIPVERSVPWYKILYQEIREGCVVRTDLKLCQLAPCMLVRRDGHSFLSNLGDRGVICCFSTDALPARVPVCKGVNVLQL